ncbi:hypothetical protein PISL3812_09967 [Talaromyces islandicus]|uniref:Uncharacterized protein n=1 Tax=Talaromyces islandicus TaxID=28573 RepID=A0A0U1MC37_TALIS|nr:hypothetical protein PISL3812_09967 [Talaromyces islandicus]
MNSLASWPTAHSPGPGSNVTAAGSGHGKSFMNTATVPSTHDSNAWSPWSWTPMPSSPLGSGMSIIPTAAAPPGSGEPPFLSHLSHAEWTHGPDSRSTTTGGSGGWMPEVTTAVWASAFTEGTSTMTSNVGFLTLALPLTEAVPTIAGAAISATQTDARFATGSGHGGHGDGPGDGPSLYASAVSLETTTSNRGKSIPFAPTTEHATTISRPSSTPLPTIDAHQDLVHGAGRTGPVYLHAGVPISTEGDGVASRSLTHTDTVAAILATASAPSVVSSVVSHARSISLIDVSSDRSMTTQTTCTLDPAMRTSCTAAKSTVATSAPTSNVPVTISSAPSATDTSSGDVPSSASTQSGGITQSASFFRGPLDDGSSSSFSYKPSPQHAAVSIAAVAGAVVVGAGIFCLHPKYRRRKQGVIPIGYRLSHGYMPSKEAIGEPSRFSNYT